jgi:hypothetical protein
LFAVAITGVAMVRFCGLPMLSESNRYGGRETKHFPTGNWSIGTQIKGYHHIHNILHCSYSRFVRLEAFYPCVSGP